MCRNLQPVDVFVSFTVVLNFYRQLNSAMTESCMFCLPIQTVYSNSSISENKSYLAWLACGRFIRERYPPAISHEPHSTFSNKTPPFTFWHPAALKTESSPDSHAEENPLRAKRRKKHQSNNWCSTNTDLLTQSLITGRESVCLRLKTATASAWQHTALHLWVFIASRG